MSSVSSGPIRSALKLNYHRERFTYNIYWDIPFEEGAEFNNFLIQYSKINKQNIFRSQKIFCTSGPFQGPGKYFEFFLLVKTDKSTAELFTKMCYEETNDQDEDFETFEFSHVQVYLFDRGSKSKREPQDISFAHVNVDKSSKCLQELESDYPKEENVCVKWSAYGYIIPGVQSITQLSFGVGVVFERWRKTSPLEHDYTGIPTSCISLKPGQLNTSDLLFSPDWSDVTIYCGDRDFPAHVLILQNTSSVLRAMFSQPMVENLTRKLTIEDSEPETVEEFLRYIYTGKVTDLSKYSVGLFVMAEKYDVQNLKFLCEKFLLANITDENVLDRYNLGKLVNSEAITSKCIREIRKNKKTIWKTEDEFYEASQKFPKLFCELFYN